MRLQTHGSRNESWLTKTDRAYTIQFGGFNLQSRMYDIDVLGYNNRTTKLHLFDVETVDESLVGEGMISIKRTSKRTLHYSYIRMILMIRDVSSVFTSSTSW